MVFIGIRAQSVYYISRPRALHRKHIDIIQGILYHQYSNVCSYFDLVHSGNVSGDVSTDVHQFGDDLVQFYCLKDLWYILHLPLEEDRYEACSLIDVFVAG